MSQRIKKKRTQLCPEAELLLYRSAQLKDVYGIKSKFHKGKENYNNELSHQKFNMIKGLDSKMSTNWKSHKLSEEKQFQNLVNNYKVVKAKKKKQITQPMEESREVEGLMQSENLENLLGINSVSQRSRKITKSNEGKQNNYEKSQMMQLKKHNEQLMRNNEQLLYEKQFFKQKVLLLEVQVRDLNRKLQSRSQTKQLKCSKKKTSNIDENPFIAKSKEIQSSRLPTQPHQRNVLKSSRMETQKSSLLISQSSSSHLQLPLQEKHINEKTNKKSIDQFNSYLNKTEREFTTLLESVQRENNQNRKATLRRMLAMKAVEIKKLKGTQ